MKCTNRKNTRGVEIYTEEIEWIIWWIYEFIGFISTEFIQLKQWTNIYY